MAGDTLTAYANWTNAHGGVNGHPVKVYIENDQGDPAVGLAAAKTLVQQDHVIAIVGQNAMVTLPSWAPYAESEKIPVIGGYLGYALFFSNPMLYPAGAGVISNAWGQFTSAKVDGATTVGILLCNNSPACIAALKIYVEAAEAAGLKVVYQQYASSTATSYTAQCLAIKSAGAEAVSAPVNSVIMSANCQQQNFTPTWISANGNPAVSTIKAAPPLAKTVGSDEHWICNTAVQPAGTSEYYSAMQQYAPQWLPGSSLLNAIGGDYNCAAWDAAMTFQQAVINANVPASTNVTNQDVITGLSKFNNTTVGAYTPPLTFSNGTTPNPLTYCANLYKYNGTNMVALPSSTGTPYTCEPDSVRTLQTSSGFKEKP